MRIIAFVNKNSGVSYHRLLAPLVTMPDVDVFATNNLLEEHFDKGCDLFIYNRVIAESAVPVIKRLKQRHGFKIILDIDDYWHLDESHVLYRSYQAEGFAARQIRHIRMADAVTTTHERLAGAIGQFHDNVHILPNAIPKGGQFLTKTEPSELVRIFWQGSDTHRYDIDILQRPVDKLNTLANKIKMVMSGWVEGSKEWDKMVETYTAGFKHQYKIIPYKEVDKYYTAYAEADICVVPLVKSVFNGMKSNLKILEAGNLALPVVASAVNPYLGLPVMFCRNGQDWIRRITALVKNPSMRMDRGMELQEYCDVNFNFIKINEERKQIFEYEASQQRVS